MRILHVFRSPLGGLFRHVRDLVRAQNNAGHDIGIVCDSASGGESAEVMLHDMEKSCSLGITRIAMSRVPGPSDLQVLRAVRRLSKNLTIDVLHGHGAKGGLYARMAGSKLGVTSVYSPHGGSLHYGWKSPIGALSLLTEKFLARKGSGFVFVCDFEKTLFESKIGLAGRPDKVVHNGLWPEEFAPAMANINAKDLLFVGELRHLKGIDLLLQAVHDIRAERKISLSVVGDGPELEHYKDMAKNLGLAEQVSFEGRKTIREAFKLGRVMVVPSRNESFPYVVLEAAAAGVPIVATAVGGIPEVMPGSSLIAAPDAKLLGRKLLAVLHAEAEHRAAARTLSQKLVLSFSAARMGKEICSFYESFRN